MPNLSSAPEVLREVALTPAWQEFWSQVDLWIEEAQLELEASASYNEFLETRAGLKVLRLVADWRLQLLEKVKELQMMSGDDNGNRS